MTNNLSQGVYAPLPQSLSDSDSEKEMPMIIRPKFVDHNVENGICENVHRNGYTRPLQTTTLPQVQKGAPMSIKRKCCFIFSISLCFLTVIVFLWVLPCSESGTCPVKISNWENQHEGIELTGKINVVKSAFKNTLNLVLFFKRNLNAVDSQSGIISVLGNDGVVAWYITQVRTPTDLNCYILDVNGDDINDCLLLGDMGLETIDPISGNVFWHAHDHSQGEVITDLSFPNVLQDLNSDSVNDLLSVKNVFNEQSKFLIISGKTGTLIGQINVDFCTHINVVQMNESNVVYLCKNGSTSVYHQVSLNELISKVFDKSSILQTEKYNYVNQAFPGYILNEKKLIVNNIGKCPVNCRVEIILVDQNVNHNIGSWYYQNSYALNTVTFSFKRTASNLSSLKGHIHGFILKLWQWYGYDGKSPRSKIVKRYIPESNSTIRVNTIMERVVLITFNSTNFHVINASLVEITQLCFPNDNLQYECQPSIENQNNSLLISDLDMDGSQELVSYSSTFVARNFHKKEWQLVSNMKVIRLEAELPKLYETAK